MTNFERINKYVTQKGVVAAKMMKDLGFSSGLYSQWKNGMQKPSMEKIKAIADYLEIPVSALLYDEEPFLEKATEKEWETILNKLSPESLKQLLDYTDYLVWKQDQVSQD